MTPNSIAVGVIIFSILALVGVLSLGGVLLRHDLSRALAANGRRPYPKSRMVEDLRPLQNTVIEFVATTGPSRRLLKLLSAGEPIRLRDEIARAPESAVTGLIIMAVAGFVRLRSGALILTKTGREVAARI